MTREGALLVILGVTVLIIGLMAWAWWRRSRRDAAPLAPPADIPADAIVSAVFESLYVVTTRHDEPLERIAAPGLGFRSRATVSVTDAGVALDLTGSPPLFLASGRLVEVDQSTVVIDRVVEPGGLTRLVWRSDAGTLVDTYLRPQDASARALADAIRPLIAPTRTGSDA